MCNKLQYNPSAVQEMFRQMRRSGEWDPNDFDTFSETRIERKWLIPPSRPAPALALRNGKAEAEMMVFGWRSPRSGLQLMARSETVEEKRMFQGEFKNQRCLVFVNGFFDSVDMGKYRQPFHLHRKDDGILAMAALWRRGGEDSFCLMSCEPNAVVRPVIDRMPVILPPEQWRSWLDAKTPADELKSMMIPYPADVMEAYPVTRDVNKPGWDGPECTVPIEPEQSELGLDLFGS